MVGETTKKHRKFETSALRRAPARRSLILADKREKLRETLVGRSPGVPPQSLRALLAGRGVRVHAVLTGPVDTDMSRGLDIPKASPESVARAIFDGVEKGAEDIFPDPMSQSMAESWRTGAAKALERQNAALVEAGRVES